MQACNVGHSSTRAKRQACFCQGDSVNAYILPQGQTKMSTDYLKHVPYVKWLEFMTFCFGYVIIDHLDLACIFDISVHMHA